ncbi:hypothetical protein FQN60_014642 [Etheostoma spectabile]|uniref:CRC domain-containing protein n=1 Tax=Etheostoma spectabile TaxID=54343 RepID=A0A5J5D7L5_9PERO|nr:hypothetical protein FQN60_014642 [Etheostoma spectabile]
MSGSMAELDTAQNKLEYIDTDDHSFKDCGGFERDSIVHPGPAAAPVWGPGPHSDASLLVPHHYQPGMVDSLTQRPVAPPADSSHPSSALAPWFANEPILCSMMPGDLHGPLPSICVPPGMDHQLFQDGPTEFTSYIPQPVVCNVSGDGQVMLVNPCEPGPMFLTMTSAPTHRDNDVSVLRTPSQYHQTACPMYESRDQATSMQQPAPPAHYCECFANGVMCSDCDCSNCHNNAEHETKRHQAIKSGDVKGVHNKGCNCKRSGCLKNYCECYEANIMCTSSCKCVDCRNYDDGLEMGCKENKWPMSVITPAVVQAACSCLLAQAEEAERDAHSPARAEHIVLDEFGHCLAQIVKAMFK